MSDGSGVDLGGVAGLIAAIGTAVGGIVVSASGLIGKRNATRVGELRRCEKHADDLEHQNLLLELWAFQQSRLLAQHGITPPPRPVIEPEPTETGS